MCPPSQAVVVAGKEKGAPLKLDLDITSEELEKKLRECLASRGRKATDPKVCTILYSHVFCVRCTTQASWIDLEAHIRSAINNFSN